MRKAICVGVSAQSHPSLTSLPHCESDIIRLSSFLESDFAKFKVEKIHNPTSKSIREQLWDVLGSVSRDDQLLIYFSGHGKRNAARKLQLCLHDTREDALPITSFSFDELLQLCNEAGAESVLIMLDCCFSGAAEKSIIAKGEGEILDPHEDAILSSKGFSVLSSCSSVELSYIDERTNMSSFTASLLELCLRKSTEMSGWLTVGQLYEELRFSVHAHSPKLVGNNPTFPVFKGHAQVYAAPVAQSSVVELREILEDYALLYGILVLPYYRSWLVGLPAESIPDNSARVGKGVYALYNEQEAYSNKINDAKKYIAETSGELEYLSDFLSTPLLLLHPVAVEEGMYKRFQGSDRKYILTTAEKLRRRQYPVITQQQYGYTISGSRPDFLIHQIPEDYLREAFGLIIDQNAHGTSVIFREDSFSKNAKYLKVESYTNRVFDSLTFGRTHSRSEVSFTSTPDEKEQFERTVSHSRARPGTLPTAITGKATAVPPKKQITASALLDKFRPQHKPQCSLCLGEKFRQVSVNNRLYTIPCRECNSGYNDSWRAFPDL